MECVPVLFQSVQSQTGMTSVTEEKHPQWDVVFEIFFEHGRNPRNKDRYVDRFKDSPTLRIAKLDLRNETRYFAYAEAALRFGPYNDWKRDVLDQALLDTRDIGGIPLAERMSRKTYDQCWEVLQGWCKRTDAWQRQRDHMNEYLKALLDQQPPPELMSETVAVANATDAQARRPRFLPRVRQRSPKRQSHLLAAGVLIGVVLLAVLAGGFLFHQRNPYATASPPPRYFSTFGTEVPAHDDPTLSLVQEVKPSSGDRSSYSQSIRAKVGDMLTITVYVYNPQRGTVYHYGRLYDELPPGGGTVALRSSLAFTDPELRRDSSVTVTIPATAHLEYMSGCGCEGTVTSLRIDHEGSQETRYWCSDCGPGTPMFLADGLWVGDLVGGATNKPDTMDPNRLWFSYDVTVVADHPDMPVWNTGATVVQRNWFQMSIEGGYPGWTPLSLPVRPGDTVWFSLYIYNDSCGSSNKGCTRTAAQDSLVGVILPLHGGRVTAVLASRNGSLLYRDLTVTLPPGQTMTYIRDSTIVDRHPMVGQAYDRSQMMQSSLPDGIANGSVQLGDLCCGNDAAIFIQFKVQVSNLPPPKVAVEHTGSTVSSAWVSAAGAMLPLVLSILVVLLLRLRIVAANERLATVAKWTLPEISRNLDCLTVL